MLKGYNKKLGALIDTDIKIELDFNDKEDTIIKHSSVEFETDGHIHCNADLEEGIKQIVNIYLERLIWKYE